MKRFSAFAAMLVLPAALWAASSYSPHKYQQNDWFGEYGQALSHYVNPAFLTELDQTEITTAMYRTLSNEAGQEYFALGVPYDYKHTYAFAFFSNGGEIDGGKAYVEDSYMFGYAYRLMHQLSLGANLALLHVNQFDLYKQITPGVDIGVSFNPLNNSKSGSLFFGLSLQNALQPRIGEEKNSSGTRFLSFWSKNAYNIPRNLNLSVYWKGLNKRLEAKGEFSFIDISDDQEDGDGWNQLENSFSFTYFVSQNLGGKMRFTKEGYPVLGFTVNTKDFNIFRYLQADLEMSHDDIVERKNRGFIWNAKLTARVGPDREEMIGDARYKMLKIEPEDDYRKAMRLYLGRQFLEAAYAFGKVITKYPAYHLVDQAAYYKGKSFENMRMHKAARATYQEALKKYRQSELRPKYAYQMMNIDYKENDFTSALNRYDTIQNKYPDSEVRTDADYILGQIRFIEGKNDEVVRLMSPILPGNANYFYARFTLGITYSRLGKWKEAEACFRDILAATPTNKSETDVQDAAKVKLGHLYFNDAGKLVEATNFYKQVSQEAKVFDEALLGLSWGFVKVNKAENALKMADYLISKFPESFSVPEAHLVKGYAYFIAKNWEAARGSLEKCIALTEKPVISKAQKDSAVAALESMKSEIEGLQMQAFDLSKQLPTERVLLKREALRPKFEKVNQTIDDSYVFMQRVIKSEQFENNRKRILEDARFTLANVKSRAGSKVIKEFEKLEE